MPVTLIPNANTAESGYSAVMSSAFAVIGATATAKSARRREERMVIL